MTNKQVMMMGISIFKFKFYLISKKAISNTDKE